MTKTLVTDELWAVVEPLLPPETPKPKGGRLHIEARAILAGILFVLKTGIPWEMLPKEMGYGSGMTCLRRLRECRRIAANRAQSATLLSTGGCPARGEAHCGQHPRLADVRRVGGCCRTDPTA